MKILYAVSESMPFVSSGGLADVAGSLPLEIKKSSDHDIRVVLPYYECIKTKYSNTMEYLTNFTVTLAWRQLYCGVFKTTYNGVIYYFLDNEYYFKRSSVYGDFDDGERFSFFSKAILDFISAIDFFPDVLHANDWQTSLCIPYLKKIYINDPRYKSIKTLFTIHNIMYQGRFGMKIYEDITGLPNHSKNDLIFDGDINFMKGAIETSDKISTVSSTYRDELLNGENAYGMNFSLNRRRNDFFGIINGIDTNYYSPNSKYIYHQLDKDILDYKKINKTRLQKDLRLHQSTTTPILCLISRLCEQKGMSIMKDPLKELLCSDIQLIILGKGDYIEEEFFKYLEKIYPDKVRTKIIFDKELSHKIYAGSDILLMPSKTEPCGISQMIACRYGTVPIVRETGGLKDTIKCYNPHSPSGACGFTFYEYTAKAFFDTVSRTLSLYKNNPNEWINLINSCMKMDFSFKKSAKQYIEVYEHI